MWAMAHVALGQQSFSLTKDSVTVDSVYKSGASNQVDITTFLVNNSNRPIEMSWNKIEKDVPDSWDVLICDKNKCYDDNVFTADFTLDAGEQMLTQIYVVTKNAGDTAHIELTFQEKNGSQSTTLTARAISVQGTTVGGAEAEASSPSVMFYPNPVQNNLYVRFPERGRHRVMVYNTLGKIIADKRSMEKDHLSIDLSAQPKGVYFLKYQTEDGKVATKTFNKN
jgi:hypothetical protein